MKSAAAVDEAGERVAQAERRDVVERHEVDAVELRVERGSGASAMVR